MAEVAWSPDGGRIAYHRLGPHTSEMVVRGVESGAQLWAVETSAGMWSTSWSSDGAWLAYTALWEGAESTCAVGVADARSGRPLDFQAAESFEMMPAWRTTVP